MSYHTLEEQKSRSAETGVASRPKRLAEYSQKEGVDHPLPVYVLINVA
jgi:hypothetical protein